MHDGLHLTIMVVALARKSARKQSITYLNSLTIGHHFSNKKIKKYILSKNSNKKSAPKLLFLNEQKLRKIWTFLT